MPDIPVTFTATLFLAFVALLALAPYVLSQLYPREVYGISGTNLSFTPTGLRDNSRALAVIFGSIAALCLLVSFFFSVPASNNGLVSSLGTPTALVSSGVGVKLPWQRVLNYSTAPLTDSYRGNGCVPVSIQHGAMCVNLDLTWSIADDVSATLLYQHYGTLDTTKLRQQLMQPALKAAAQRTFGDFDPLSSSTPSLAALSDLTTERLEELIGGMITVVDLTIQPFVPGDFDSHTQALLNTLISQQRAAQVAANLLGLSRMLQTSGDPYVQCLQDLNGQVQAHPEAPVGFYCTLEGVEARK